MSVEQCHRASGDPSGGGEEEVVVVGDGFH